MDLVDASKLEVKNMEVTVLRTQQMLSSIYEQLLFLYQPINSGENLPILVVLQSNQLTNLRNTA